MKKIAVSILSLCLCITLFAGCEFVMENSSSVEKDSSILLSSEIAESETNPESSEISSAPIVSSEKNVSSKVTVPSKASSKPPVSSKVPTPSSSKETRLESSKPIQQSEESITLASVTSPIGKNETASLTIKGKPNTEYDISVYYSSGASTAAGLENKTSGTNGSVTWQWKVGGKTKPGTYRIKIVGGGQTLETEFTVVE